MKQKNVFRPKEKSLQVQFYSGYRGYETPRSIIIDKKEYLIKKITERKRIADQKSGKQYTQFLCQTLHKTYLIKVFELWETYEVKVYEKQENSK